MALPEDFSKIFGSTTTGGLTPIGDVNYAKGWEFVGSNPPTKNDFSYLQNLSDLKSQWLYSNKLQRANPFGDIKSDGAVQAALVNLGLGDIALAGVSSGALDVNGYAYMPLIIGGARSNLIIQWGTGTTSTSGTTHTFPVAFPNSAFIVLGTDAGTASLEYIATSVLSNSQFSARGSSSSPGFNYIAIGN